MYPLLKPCELKGLSSNNACKLHAILDIKLSDSGLDHSGLLRPGSTAKFFVFLS